MRELRSALTMAELALEESTNERRDLEERVTHLTESGDGGGEVGGDTLKIDALVREMQTVKNAREKERKEFVGKVEEARARAVEEKRAAEEAVAIAKSELEAERRNSSALQQRLASIEDFLAGIGATPPSTESVLWGARSGDAGGNLQKMEDGGGGGGGGGGGEEKMKVDRAAKEVVTMMMQEERCRMELQRKEMTRKMEELAQKEASLTALLSMANATGGGSGGRAPSAGLGGATTFEGGAGNGAGGDGVSHSQGDMGFGYDSMIDAGEDGVGRGGAGERGGVRYACKRAL